MKDYVFNFLNKGFSLVAGLILSIILARYLGVEMRGEYAFIVQTGTLVALFLGFGAAQSLPFFYRKGSQWYPIIRSLIIQLWIASTLLALGCLVLTGFTMLSLIAITAAVCMGYQQLEVAMAVVNIRLKIRVNILFSIAKVAFLLVAVSVSVPGPWMELWLAICSMWVAWTLSALSYVIFAGGRSTRVPLTSTEVRQVFRFSWLPMLTNVLVVLNYNVDLILVRVLSTATETGIFAVALGLATYLWVGADAIKEVLVSRVVKSNDLHAIVRPLHAALGLTVIGSSLVALFGQPLINLFYGAEFSEAYAPAIILGVGAIAMVWFKVLGVAVLSYGYRGFYFVALFLAVCVNTVLALWLIPPYGAVGAAWAAASSYSCTGLLFLAYFSRKFRIPIWRMLIPSLRR